MILALVLMAAIQTTMLAFLYKDVGELDIADFSARHPKDNKAALTVYIFNWLGLVTLMSSDQFIMCGFAIVV